MSCSEVRITVNCLLRKQYSFLLSGLRINRLLCAAAQIQIPGSHIFRGPVANAFQARLIDFRKQPPRNRLTDFVLNDEDIRQSAVKGFGPDGFIVINLDKLSADTYLLAITAHTSSNHIANPQLSGDFDRRCCRFGI